MWTEVGMCCNVVNLFVFDRVIIGTSFNKRSEDLVSEGRKEAEFELGTYLILLKCYWESVYSSVSYQPFPISLL